jgi:Flp pilus assembly protein TadD
LGDPLGAVREYERAATLDPNEPNYFEWGTELLFHRAVRPAVIVFKKGSVAHPNSARMLVGLGAALYADGSYDEAASQLCRASDLKPEDATPYLFLGKMEVTSPTSFSCGEERLARFAQNQPGNALANYYFAMAVLKRNRESKSSADSQQAEALLKKSVAIDPKLGEAYLQLGILHAAQGDSDQAIDAFKKAVEVTPGLGEAHYRLSQLYKRSGEKAKADQEIQLYRQVEKSETDAVEQQRREIQQFLIILKDQPAVSAPQ